jgi:hypothetical protein
LRSALRYLAAFHHAARYRPSSARCHPEARTGVPNARRFCVHWGGEAEGSAFCFEGRLLGKLSRRAECRRCAIRFGRRLRNSKRRPRQMDTYKRPNGKRRRARLSLLQLLFCAKPILNVMAIFAAALLIKLVSASLNLLFRWECRLNLRSYPVRGTPIDPTVCGGVRPRIHALIYILLFDLLFGEAFLFPCLHFFP